MRDPSGRGEESRSSASASSASRFPAPVEQLDDVLADCVQTHPLVHQNGRGNAALLAQEAEQQMLVTDVVVQQPVGFLGGKVERTFCFHAERNFDRRRDLFRKTIRPSISLRMFSSDRWSARKSGWSALYLRESDQEAGARSQWTGSQAGWPRSGRRRGPGGRVRCSVRT